MSIDFGGQANLNISGTPYLTIDTSGRVLEPFQTAFAANNGNGATSGQDVIFGSTTFNIGSAYNTANGRFTAPVAGTYYFRYHQLAPNANAGEFRTALYKNGAGFAGLRFIMNKAAGTWWAVIAEGHANMAVGDYVTVRYESGPAGLYTDGNYNCFSGHLIG